MDNEEIKKGRKIGTPNQVYYPSGVVRVPIELIEPVELLVKTYKEQRKAWKAEFARLAEQKLAQQIKG